MWRASSTCSILKPRSRAPRRQSASSPQARPIPIAKACKANSFDLGALAEAATRSGNLAIPLVKALTAEVAKADADAARYVHWGATSQDVIDTATMLTLRAAIDALLADIDRAIAGFAGLARQHRNTAGRGAHLAAACVADAVRPQARGICRGTASLARAVAAIAQRGAGAAVRRRRGHPGRARRQGIAGREELGAGAQAAAARRARGTPIATASRRPPRCSRFLPAPAARSPATCR